MKHAQHDIFIAAIHGKNKLCLTSYSQKDDMQVTRVVAPMDFGPKSNETSQVDRYHFWDFTSPSGPHPESLEASRIQSMSQLNEAFDPADFVTWRSKWHIQRDWGSFS